jgi:hypothetical protein
MMVPPFEGVLGQRRADCVVSGGGDGDLGGVIGPSGRAKLHSVGVGTVQKRKAKLAVL